MTVFMSTICRKHRYVWTGPAWRYFLARVDGSPVMVWIPTKTIEERISAANAELKAACRDGKCDDITAAMGKLDGLL